ncbi:MAG: molybdate ABC transporter substrate-binding protein [Eubacteriales bacterium]|nr:molybdate ABC transporter substrate-binding protein [Eubacteriales bacterium]
MKKKNFLSMLLMASLVLSLSACGSTTKNAEVKTNQAEITTINETETETNIYSMKGEIMLAAAASLEKSFTQKLIPMFNELYPNIKVTGTYDSSGKLQTQIEEGADVDIFFSAAMKQMNALIDKNLMNNSTVVQLLENKIVLIVPKGTEADYTKFEDITKANAIAIGDPESVPAGQYAKESLTNLGLWDQVEAKASLGTNVTEVLNWVAEGSANAGVVYATDAAKMPDKVTVIDAAPSGSVKPVIYPVGMTASSKNVDSAKAFLDFLQMDNAKKVFTDNGFAIAN